MVETVSSIVSSIGSRPHISPQAILGLIHKGHSHQTDSRVTYDSARLPGRRPRSTRSGEYLPFIRSWTRAAAPFASEPIALSWFLRVTHPPPLIHSSTRQPTLFQSCPPHSPRIHSAFSSDETSPRAKLGGLSPASFVISARHALTKSCMFGARWRCGLWAGWLLPVGLPLLNDRGLGPFLNASTRSIEERPIPFLIEVLTSHPGTWKPSHLADSMRTTALWGPSVEIGTVLYANPSLWMWCLAVVG